MLSGRFQGQGHHDPLDILPLLQDERRIELAAGLQYHVVIVLTRGVEAIERSGLCHRDRGNRAQMAFKLMGLLQLGLNFNNEFFGSFLG